MKRLFFAIFGESIYWTGFLSGVIACGLVLCGLYIRLSIEVYRVQHGVYRSAASDAPYGYPTSDTAKQIASTLSPGLQSAAKTHQRDFVSRSGGPVTRFAANAVYPAIVREVPVGVEILTDQVLTHFGSFSLGDLAKILVAHAKAKGVHPNFGAVPPDPTLCVCRDNGCKCHSDGTDCDGRGGCLCDSRLLPGECRKHPLRDANSLRRSELAELLNRNS